MLVFVVAATIAAVACDDADAPSQPSACAFFSGFEAGTATKGLDWDTLDPGVSVERDVVRSGEYALKVTATAAVPAEAHTWLYNAAGEITPYATPWVTFHMYVASLPAPASRIISLENQVQPFQVISLALRADGKLEVYDANDHRVGNGETALKTGRWYRVDLHVVQDQKNGRVEVRVDSEPDISLRDIDTSVQGPNQIRLGAVGLPASNFEIYFDDLYVDAQNPQPDGQASAALLPNATGGDDGWSVQPASAQKWETIDDLPPDDGDYVALGGPSNATQSFKLSSGSDAGITGQVRCIAVFSRVLSPASDVGPTILVREGGSETVIAGVGRTDYRWQRPTFLSSRPPGGPWTGESLDSLEIGVRAALSAGEELRISSLVVSAWYDR
jgi:hypothetical protein